MRIIGQIKRFGNCIHGAALIEFAVIAPVFFMLVFGSFFWFLLVWHTNSVQYAAMLSARCGVMAPPPGSGTGQKKCGAFNNASTLGLSWIPKISELSFEDTTPVGTSEFCSQILIDSDFEAVFSSFNGSLNRTYCRPK